MLQIIYLSHSLSANYLLPLVFQALQTICPEILQYNNFVSGPKNIRKFPV